MSAHLGLGPDDPFDEVHVCREGGGLTLHLGSAGAFAGPVDLPVAVASARMPYLEGAMAKLCDRAVEVREHAARTTMPEVGIDARGHMRPN